MNKSKILFAWGSFSKKIDFLFPVLILFVAGCGYSIMGGNPPLPMEAKSIGIQPVENHTFVAGLDTKTNAAIKNLLETNASVEIVPAAKADLQLTISLNEIRSKTSGLDSLQSVGGVVFYLSGSVELNQRVDGEMIWREKILKNKFKKLTSLFTKISQLLLKDAQIIKCLCQHIIICVLSSFL